MRMTVSEGGALKAMNSKDDTEVRVSSVIWMFWLWITARPPPRREGQGLVMYLKPGGDVWLRENKSSGCCQVSVSRRKSRDFSKISSWRMRAFLLSDRMLRRAMLVEWEGRGVVTG